VGVNDIKVGDRFGKLEVRACLGVSATVYSSKQTIWKCRCDCGEIIIRGGHLLAKGCVKSCGCLRREMGLAKLKKGHETRSRCARERRLKLPAERGVSDEMDENELVARDSVSTGCAVRG
jgi:hypothetical protein